VGSGNNTGGFHVFGGNREAGSAGSVRSFSGQGGEVWENSPAARNIIPRSQSLSTLHSSFAGSTSARLSAPLSASARSTGGSALASSRRLPGTINQTNSFRRPFGTSVFPRNGFGRGCWNCGFGFGGWRGGWGWHNNWGWGFWGGWGFGWPWLGFWGWDPFIYDPWWGWPGPGYGYYGWYNNNYVYGSPTAGNLAPENDSTPPPSQDMQYNSSGNWIAPNGPSPSSSTDSEILTVPFLIYMKSGEIHTVRDYWMVDGKFYYLRMDGAERSVNLEEIDLARTNTENANSGVKFIFKSAPSAAPTAPDEKVAPPASTEPSPSPKTEHQNDQPSQPEART
jgi:hypothetical protein